MNNDTNIYVINLKDKEHRFKVFEELNDSRIQRFEAVDTRKNPKKYEELGLTLNPVGLVNKLYFSQMYGAIGCFLSHFLIWKKIINENLESALILEDDASCCDVASFLNESKEYPALNELSMNKFDLVQLNKRTHSDIKIYTKFFDGTESYCVTNEGAKKLVNFVEDSYEFKDKVIPMPLKNFKSGSCIIEQRKYEAYKDENTDFFNWNLKNNIPAAVDKFIGYCATLDLSGETKLKIQVSKKIGLHYQKIPSDIMHEGDVGHWKFTEQELNEFMKSDKFEWWKK